ncbi:MAG: bifunctional glycoside hydrolase 114/ polysaccharide deacetylase family protein [Fibrobacteria bacterium]
MLFLIQPLRADSTDFAFYYGVNPPLEELSAFDRVIVDPDYVKTPPTPRQDSTGPTWLAYVALGEANQSRDYYRKIPPAWFLGKNQIWGSGVLDQTPPSWPDFYLAHVIAPLWKKGYRGFFFDALDSYQLFVSDEEGRARQAAGQATVLRRIKKAYPGAYLMLNRGFEVLPKIHDAVSAVAFESLFQGWNEGEKKFFEVPEQDRFFLLEKAQEIVKQYHLPVVAIDYVAAGDRSQARATAERIKSVGLIPWVTTPAVDQVGIGSKEVQPRKVLMLYDGKEQRNLDELPIHRNLSPMLTYLGYVPEYRDIREPPPAYPLQGRYAGIVSWLQPGSSIPKNDLALWLVAQASQGMKMAFLGQLPFATVGPVADAFGLKASVLSKVDTMARILVADPIMHFEMEPIPDARMVHPLKAGAGKTLLRVVGNSKDTMDAAAFAPWGGYALAPFVIRDLPVRKALRWVLQPMDFLARALALPVLPAPDFTTENGTRLLMVHVDGDGFANLAEWVPNPFAGEVIKKEILDRYPFATTFSIIEGEVSDEGMYPDVADKLQPIAKRILALPHVEIASHTYSHPFDWPSFKGGGKQGRENHLDIKGFRFGPLMMQREIFGSIRYINETLAPKGKVCKVLLWSGNCNPDETAVGLTYAAGVANINGGETLITSSSDSWTGIAPIGIDRGGHYQIFAPNQNENLYTNEWKGPFYGYENVIETFERTDRPLRFKPVDIYYHTYSGSKQASLAALKKVYDWALGQNLFNLYVSEYVPKILDFNGFSLAKSGSAWAFRGRGDLRELRIPASMGFPDLAKSRGIAGYADVGGNRYIHATGSEGLLVLGPRPPTQPFLWSANGALAGWEARGRGFLMTLRGHLDLAFVLAGAGSCRVTADGKPLEGNAVQGGNRAFKLAARGAAIEVACP